MQEQLEADGTRAAQLSRCEWAFSVGSIISRPEHPWGTRPSPWATELSFLSRLPAPLSRTDNLYVQFDFSNQGAGIVYDGTNWPLVYQRVDVYQCPLTVSTPISFEVVGPPASAFTTHYYGVAGPTGINPQTGVAYQVFAYSPSCFAEWPRSRVSSAWEATSS